MYFGDLVLDFIRVLGIKEQKEKDTIMANVLPGQATPGGRLSLDLGGANFPKSK